MPVLTRSPDESRWPPKVQIAGVSSLEEAIFCAEVGVDAAGFTLELPSGIHDGLTRRRARHIIRRLPPSIIPVVITYVQSADDACSLVLEVGARAIQFHGGISDEQIVRFREVCPAIRTIGRVTVSGEQALFEAARFVPPSWDALILDSFDPATGSIGATGLTHEWSLSARIVEASRVPVILAGGLNPDNVAQAIAMVRPHGVDAHTGVENSDGTRNFEKIKRLAQAGLKAFAINRTRPPRGSLP
jgi:phosphoribosylanthranilate isomerase